MAWEVHSTINCSPVTLIHRIYFALIILCMNALILLSQLNFEFKKCVILSYRLPWNQNTLQGWMIETLYSSFFSACYCLMAPLFLILFVSVCNYHDAFYKLFRFQIANIDATAGFEPFPTVRIMETMHQSISLHISAKE